MPQAGQINYPNFAAIFNAAAQFRQQQLQEERYRDAKTLEEKQALQRQKVQQEWQKATQHMVKTGDVGAAMQMISDAGAQQKFAPYAQQFMKQRKDRADAMTLSTSQVMGRSIKELEAAGYDDSVHHQLAVNMQRAERAGRVSPGSTQRWVDAGRASRAERQKLIQSGQPLAEGAMAGAAKPVWDALRSDLEISSAGLIEEKVAKTPGFQNAVEKLAAVRYWKDNPETSAMDAATLRQQPGWAGYVDQAEKDAEELRLKAASANADRTTVRFDDPTRGARTQFQKEHLMDVRMLTSLNRARAEAKPEMFGVAGRAKAKVTSALSFLNPEWVPQGWKQEHRARRKVVQELERLFSMYRKRITGAQAAMAELEYLREQQPNESMSWEDYKASVDQFFEELTTAIRLNQKVLADGIPLTEADLQARVDQLHLEGDDGRSQIDINRRMNELKKVGLSPRRIVEVMMSEGYYTPKQGKLIIGEMED